MFIAGEWKLCDDSVARPVVRTNVVGTDEIPYAEDFLVDTGADHTVFSAALLERLRLPTRSPLTGTALSGIGGECVFVMVTTRVELLHDAGGLIRIHGEFASFTDPTATDLSILGRDVLDNFDLIVSLRHNHVLLLAPRHQYHIARG